MDNKICKFCGGKNQVVKNPRAYGDHIALICTECGKWQKWLSKKELQTLLDAESVQYINYDNPFSQKDETVACTESCVDGLPFDIEQGDIGCCAKVESAEETSASDNIEKMKQIVYDAAGVPSYMLAKMTDEDKEESLVCNQMWRANLKASVPLEKDEILRDSQRYYGENFEKNIAIEELSELIKELAKDFRGIGNSEHIAEEMADVYIMLRQLEIMYKNGGLVQRYIDEKLTRLKENIEAYIARCAVLGMKE